MKIFDIKIIWIPLSILGIIYYFNRVLKLARIQKKYGLI